MANLITKIDYEINNLVPLNIVNISLLEEKKNKKIDISFKLSDSSLQIQMIKLLIKTFSFDGGVLDDLDIVIKYEELVKENDIYHYSLDVDCNTSYGGIYISGFIDSNLVSQFDLGMYSFATKEKIAQEVQQMYNGQPIEKDYFKVERHVSSPEPVNNAVPAVKQEETSKGLFIASIVAAGFAILLIIILFFVFRG